MFDSMIQPYMDRIGPMARDVGATAQGYAERIIARLDDIADAVRSEEFEEQRRRFPVTIPGITAADTVKFDIPPGEDWLLEAVTVSAGGNISVAIGNQDAVGGNLAGRSFYWIGNFPFVGTEAGSGVLFNGAQTLGVVANANTPALVYLQFRVRLRKRRAVAAVFPLADPVPDGAGAVLEQGRHGNTDTRRPIRLSGDTPSPGGQ